MLLQLILLALQLILLAEAVHRSCEKMTLPAIRLTLETEIANQRVRVFRRVLRSSRLLMQIHTRIDYSSLLSSFQCSGKGIS